MKGARFLETKILPLVIGWIITILFAWQAFWPETILSPFFNRMEALAYDMRLRATFAPHRILDLPIAIVDIDEKSLQKIGRWPWSRTTMAQLTQQLTALKAGVIAYDIVFSEPERNPINVITNTAAANHIPPDVVSSLQTLIPLFDADTLFAESLKNQPTLLAFFLDFQTTPSVGLLPKPIEVLPPAQVKQLPIINFNHYTANLPQLQLAAQSGGFVTTDKDLDGTIRKAPLVFFYGNDLYPSLALAAAKAYLLIDQIRLATSPISNQLAVDGLWLDKEWIPTDESGRVLIPFLGPSHTFTYISALDVLEKKVPQALIEGKIILVGSSSLGLADLSATAAQNIYPGVEVHANIIAGLLTGHFPYEPGWATGAHLALIVFIGVFLSIILNVAGPVLIILVGFGMMALHIVVNVWIWSHQGYALTMVLPLMLILILMVLYTAHGFLFESRHKKQITNMFGQYVAPAIVKMMSQDPAHYDVEGKSQELTVLFSDICHFTTLSEGLTATQVKELLNAYFEPMTEIIFRQQGTIDKYVGDMIMAFWGAPFADPNQANHAIAAGMEMCARRKLLAIEFQARGLPIVDMGIGINTGPMHVGDMGSKYRRAYTVLGDAVNLGSRLEALTRFYDISIIIGETTFDQQTAYCCRLLDRVKVKGKNQAVKIYEPLCLKTEMDEKLHTALALYDSMLADYLQQNWDAAEAKIDKLLTQYPQDPVYHLYQSRIIALREHPPGPDFDGVMVRDTK